MLSRLIIKTFILSIILVYLGTGALFAQSVTNDFSLFMGNIQQKLSTTNIRADDQRLPIVKRQRVFRQFCDVMREIDIYMHADQYIVYNARQSAFVHIVCGPFDLVSELGSFGLGDGQKQYFLKDGWQTLGIYDRDTNRACDPVFTMEQCDVARKFSHIMHNILNDMFDIKQSSIYGGTLSGDNVNALINAFTSGHFMGLELCPQNKCNYPKTHNRLKAYMKRGEGLLKSLDILNWPHVQEQLKNTAIDCSFPFTTEYHVFVCGLDNRYQTGLSPFIAAINNEMFFYRLFMTWYMGWIENERRLLPSEDQNIQRATVRAADIIQKTQQQINRTQEAVDMSIRLLREMHTTFPIHIGLLIYYEDLYRMRRELAKVVTPLYTLYDKLRNVQDAND